MIGRSVLVGADDLTAVASGKGLIDAVGRQRAAGDVDVRDVAARPRDRPGIPRLDGILDETHGPIAEGKVRTTWMEAINGVGVSRPFVERDVGEGLAIVRERILEEIGREHRAESTI